MTVFSIELIGRNVTRAPNHHIRVISKGCETKTCVKAAQNLALHFKICKNKLKLNCNNILLLFTVYCYYIYCIYD